MSGHIRLIVQKLHQLCSDSSVVRGGKYGRHLRAKSGISQFFSLLIMVLPFFNHRSTGHNERSYLPNNQRLQIHKIILKINQMLIILLPSLVHRR